MPKGEDDLLYLISGQHGGICDYFPEKLRPNPSLSFHRFTPDKLGGIIPDDTGFVKAEIVDTWRLTLPTKRRKSAVFVGSR